MKKLIVFLLAASLLLTCGCSLAKPEEELNGSFTTEDSLIGVLVTNEHLDLFDMEAWLNDNINTIAKGGETVIGGDTSQYQGRIYAKPVEKEWTASDGSTQTTTEYEFPEELNGHAFLCPTLTDERGEHYTSSSHDEVFADSHVHIKSGDAGNAVELTATIYYDPLTIPKESITELHEDGTETPAQHIAFYHNPIYQTPEGDVYVVSGSGSAYSAGPGVGFYGEQGTYFFHETKSVTINGKTEELKNAVSITMHAVRYAEKIVVHEMREDNKLLRTAEYSHGDFPRELTVGSDAAYVIIETHSMDENGEVMVNRQICTADSEEESFDVFVPLNNGYVSKQQTKVIRENVVSPD